MNVNSTCLPGPLRAGDFPIALGTEDFGAWKVRHHR